ncbi:transcription factor bHLH93-like isoform X1 [Bidens hawaiensis]|uniref:transcription factor bHLH93-like isoform X1 n=1 Tax=Bidens hawaiensis TaxID=980011 RepID=UPI00404A7DD0
MQMHQPISQQGLLEDLVAPTMEIWSTFSNSQELTTIDTTHLFPLQEEDDFLLLPSSSSFSQLISSSLQPDFQSPYTDESIYSSVPCFDTFVPINGSVSSSYDQQMFPLIMEQEDNDGDEEPKDHVVSHDKIPTAFNMGLNEEKKSKSKKVEGQPSKNLMAERRRRKRLNDRLTMLRSIVPKISKMDRTSILGDTIDYMKELMEKIQDLKEQDIDSDVDHMKMLASVKEFNMNESHVRNPPKFHVERGNIDTRIQICCSTKPGLLLSTLNTLEALGLDMQQCVISCFNEFSLQASCSEAQENRSMIGCDEMKQILFRNAGYGGRCL